MLKERMKENWLERLREVIDADQRSLRQISMDAGLGPNYVQQMLHNGKAPTIDKLQAILDTLGTARTFYIITGVHVSQRDVEFLQLVLAAPEHLRGPIRQILAAVEAGQS